MQHVSGLLVRLNLRTRHWHTAVDEPWLDLLRPNVTRTDYLALLVRTDGFIAPFEAACKYTPGLERVLDFRRLTRAGLIAQDLLSLGLTPAQLASIPHCQSITTFATIPEALGWLYVIERSMLLQNGILEHVRSRLDIEYASAYLSANHGQVGDQWNAFGRTLDRIASDPEIADDILAAANHGFACIQHWYQGLYARRMAAST